MSVAMSIAALYILGLLTCCIEFFGMPMAGVVVTRSKRSHTERGSIISSTRFASASLASSRTYSPIPCDVGRWSIRAAWRKRSRNSGSTRKSPSFIAWPYRILLVRSRTAYRVILLCVGWKISPPPYWLREHTLHDGHKFCLFFRSKRSRADLDSQRCAITSN